VMRGREPDFVVGSWDDPYLLRWWMIPRNDRLNFYLHLFLRSDTDEALHDHMYHNVSIVLEGGYLEHFVHRPPVRRQPGSLVFRRPETPHRVELIDGRPSVSLFITGPRVRQWGFHCPNGWVHWKKFVDASEGVT